MKDTQPKKKHRRRRNSIWSVLLTLLITSILILSIYIVNHIKTLNSFNGIYTREIDLTDRIVSETAIWLSDLEGVTIDRDWLLSNTDSIILSLDLTLTKSGAGHGTYTISPNEDAYSTCRMQAYTLVSNCLTDVISSRLEAAGYDDDLTDEEADALIISILGTDLETYLIDKELSFIPEYDDFVSQYSSAGTYEVHGTYIDFTADNSNTVSKTYYGSKDGSILVCDDSIYQRKATQP